MKLVLLSLLFFTLSQLNLLAQTNTNTPIYIDKVFVNFNVADEDTSILEYMNDKYFESKKSREEYQFVSSYKSLYFDFYNKYKDLVSETLRERLEKKLIKEKQFDPQRNDAFYRPDDFDVVVKIKNCKLSVIGSGASQKHVYTLETNVSMLNKSDKEVYNYNQSISSTPRKISSYSKLTNAIKGTYDVSKMDLLYDTLLTEAVNSIFSATHIDEINKHKLVPNNGSENKIADKKEISEPKKEEVVEDTTNKEPDPVFSTLLMSAKNQKPTGDLSEFLNSIVSVTFGKTTFSGIIVSEDGYILTSYQVLDGKEDQVGKATLSDGKTYQTVTHRMHKNGDLLLLKIAANNLTPLVLKNSNESKMGSEIYAVGTSVADELGQSVSKGIIAGNRVIEKRQLVQLDVKINGEVFGGAVLSPKGDLMGMLYSKLVGFGVEGISFAISPKEIIRMLNLEYK